MKEAKKTHRIEHWHKVSILLALYDIVAVNVAYILALWFRFDCRHSMIPDVYLNAFVRFAPIYTVLCLLVFWGLKLYNSIWRFASFRELTRVVVASFITSMIHIVGITAFYRRFPITYYVIGMGLQFLFVLGIRFSYRFFLLEQSRLSRFSGQGHPARVMIIGAGNAGQMILHDALRTQNPRLDVRCIIDDNSNKWGRYIEGVPVIGGRDDILLAAKKYNIERILVAIPSASPSEKRDVLNICKETGCELKNLPGIYQMLSGSIGVGDLKDVAVEDLLGRDPIKVDMENIYRYISGKTILVTGGGGSIGSELCRQVAGHNPKHLIIFDVYENNAYDIQQELKEKHPNLNMTVIIGSIRDSRRINSVFATYRPDIVYHAAAHKHVPLMEDSPCESIKNNVIGTYKTAYAAMLYGCKRFVLISTDKAVNPTNIMGASKRLCEMVIQSFDKAIKSGKADSMPCLFTHQVDETTEFPPVPMPEHPTTEFVAVRFGNVLGSNGSVIPLFKKQIAKGGPVTVTHPDIIRYFMTIPEAVSLVMQAGTYAKGGEIFILDMGAPVKIDDLARNLIKLSGHKPDEDIPILYTGLRPGEKLYEEKLMAEEGLQKTENDLIHIGNPLPFDTDEFLQQLTPLMEAAYANDPNIRDLVASIVSTYHPAPLGTDKKDATFEKLHQQAMEKE